MIFRLRHLLAALLLHGLLIALLGGGMQCSRTPVRPPVIHAVLLDPDRKQQEAQRKRAEEQRRAEQRRRAEAEKKRAEEARQKQLAEEAQRRKLEEAQRQKELADRKKAEELARRKKEQEEQRERQDQARRDAQEQARMEEAIRQEALRRDLEREQAARAASERERRLAEWADALQRHVQKHWIRPAGGTAQFECQVRVEQLPDGSVTSARIVRSCGDAALDRSVEEAVLRASPLPKPADPSVFERELVINFKPRGP